MALGVVAVLSSVRTLAYGWTELLYAGPPHRFTYLGLGWVLPPGPLLLRVLIVTVAGAGVAVALGWHTRLAAAVLLVAFGWIELIDATTYLNHYWFVTLLAAIAVVAPLGAAGSLDARRAGGPRPVAVGWVWLLRFQVGVLYLSAGLAKLQSDWLLRALPLRLWLPARADLPLVGGLLEFGGTAHVLSVAGAAFDCTIVPLLLWRRTRPWAWLVLVAFHVATWILFPIGVFPWLMIGVSTVFFAPDWARRPWGRRAATPRASPTPRAATGSARRATGGRCVLAVFAAAWVALHLALPLRHLAYPGDHRWSAEGYRFGWNVLLVERSGSVTFVVRDPATGRTWTADLEALYTRAQIRVMTGEPDLIHQAARAIAADEARRGHRVEVRGDAWLSLNGRPAARWIDPTVDLAAEPRTLLHQPWILPAP
ncbi:MAG TPA: HTTM domain-containing protein [Iamia sp.]|nr:HTTM domain-containing protein [Iamia sp.]